MCIRDRSGTPRAGSGCPSAVEPARGFAPGAGVGDGTALGRRPRRRSGSARRRADPGRGRAGVAGRVDVLVGVLVGGLAGRVPVLGGPALCGRGDLVCRWAHLLGCGPGWGWVSAASLARGRGVLVVLPADAGRALRGGAPPRAGGGVSVWLD